MDTLTIIIAIIVNAFILYLVIESATKTKTTLSFQRLQTKIFIEMARKLGVDEGDIKKHFTSEGAYNRFASKKSSAE